MKVSVVIPAFNEEKLLPATLAAVNAANVAWTDRGWNCETIVCNNNSTDRTGQVATEAGATVVFEPVNQIGRARNAGAARASGEWIVFVDADSQPSCDLFAAAASAIEKGNVIAGGTTIQIPAAAWDIRLMLTLWNTLSRVRGWMAGAFIFVDAQAFRKVGGFSSELFVGEELELAQKLKKLGRQERKKIVILNRTPLLTSGRKTELYSRKELTQFLFRFILQRKATQTNRAACNVWYDGRR